MKIAKKNVPVSPRGYVNYKDVNLRKFNGTVKIAHCEAALADIIGFPAEAV